MNIARIEDALSGLGQAFAADGYALRVVELDGPKLKIKIDAGPDACAECLVPLPVMVALIKTDLPKDMGILQVDVDYPVSNSKL